MKLLWVLLCKRFSHLFHVIRIMAKLKIVDVLIVSILNIYIKEVWINYDRSMYFLAIKSKTVALLTILSWESTLLNCS